MRIEADKQRIWQLIEAIGKNTKGKGNVYLVGGATAVLYGWRSQTIDVDLKLDPEPAGIFSVIRILKDELNINIELASPDQFIPALPDWQQRSPYITTIGQINFYHYDLYAQVLAKIERGHTQDILDVKHYLTAELVDPNKLQQLFNAIYNELERYPAINANEFQRKLDLALRDDQ
ncbi:MAG: hypothetical protein JW841_04465 [Deltaproteobacteria bacterium]|nr:hypothetical protein [Deltaproteobacteria bacterium]